MKIITKNPSCQHFHIDNATGQCRACSEQMVGQTWTADTVTSAPNLAQCKNPRCEQALAEGTYDETNPPADCTNPDGTYIEDRNNAREVTIGYLVTYECSRCSQNGTIFSADGISWDCGKSHEGQYIPEKELT